MHHQNRSILFKQCTYNNFCQCRNSPPQKKQHKLLISTLPAWRNRGGPPTAAATFYETPPPILACSPTPISSCKSAIDLIFSTLLALLKHSMARPFSTEIASQFNSHQLLFLLLQGPTHSRSPQILKCLTAASPRCATHTSISVTYAYIAISSCIHLVFFFVFDSSFETTKIYAMGDGKHARHSASRGDGDAL